MFVDKANVVAGWDPDATFRAIPEPQHPPPWNQDIWDEIFMLEEPDDVSYYEGQYLEVGLIFGDDPMRSRNANGHNQGRINNIYIDNR